MISHPTGLPKGQRQHLGSKEAHEIKSISENYLVKREKIRVMVRVKKLSKN